MSNTSDLQPNYVKPPMNQGRGTSQLKIQTDSQERHFLLGERAAWQQVLRLCIRNLGYDGFEKETLILERESAITALRELCATSGDNDWDDNLDLSDIINKHLADHLAS